MAPLIILRYLYSTMKKVIKMTMGQLKEMVKDTINERFGMDEFDDEDNGENANEYLNSLFNTEDDYDGEPYRGDEEGFSNKMRQKHIAKSIKTDHLGMGAVHPSYSKKKDIEIPRDEQGKEIKWSPMKSDDLPLDKYLEKKKTRDLDEEDLTDDNFNDYLDSLFVKD